LVAHLWPAIHPSGRLYTYTNCTYYTAGYATFHGYYQDATSASGDAAAVQSFCVEHFAARTR